MSAVTYSVATATASVAGRATANRRKGFFTIVFEAIAKSQRIRAERELARYRHLLPHDFTLGRSNEE